jgi:hypothetical protein
VAAIYGIRQSGSARTTSDAKNSCVWSSDHVGVFGARAVGTSARVHGFVASSPRFMVRRNAPAQHGVYEFHGRGPKPTDRRLRAPPSSIVEQIGVELAELPGR